MNLIGKSRVLLQVPERQTKNGAILLVLQYLQDRCRSFAVQNETISQLEYWLESWCGLEFNYGGNPKATHSQR
jgi:hypothetical protein